jgi:hypothetical protein
MVATIVLFLFVKQRPMRMDYNLFLRAAQGLLKFSGADELPPANRLNRRELLVFARFLGSRFLVCNFRWETGGLRLRLPPVANRFLTNMAALFLPSISRNCSHILLGWDGTIRAQCGKADAQNLTALQTSGPTNPQELESLVEASVVQAWREFRHGNFAAAERMVGDSPELEVFLVPPTRAKSMRWWRIFIGASVVLMMAAMMLRLLPSAWMARLDGLKPVNVTEAQVQEFLSLVSTNPNPLVAENIGGTKGYTQNSYAWDPTMALLTCLVLPETNRFTPQRRQMLRAAIFYGADPQTQDKSKNLWLGVSQLAKRALLCGWIDWPDLNLAPEDVSREIHQGKFHEIEFKYEYLLVRESAWSWVESTRWDVLRAGEMTLTQLRWLRDVNGLDLVDREKLIAQIVAVQTLSAHPPGNPPIHDWKDVRGLFFTPCYPALQDTYFSVATLEILGGLDRMDREECIRGILRRHQGRGCFTSPSSGNYNEYHIDGSARDTLAAFETLRMLGALERVKDLDRWQFRVASYNSSQPGANGVRTLTWPEIEAWECQRRLEHILGQHRENPAAPVRSLLAP